MRMPNASNVADHEQNWRASNVRLANERIEENLRRYRQAISPLLPELRTAGFDVETVGDLYNTPIWYEAAIPILTRWLPKVTYNSLKSDIIRALSVKWAKPV